jgi:hypothetical protein
VFADVQQNVYVGGINSGAALRIYNKDMVLATTMAAPSSQSGFAIQYDPYGYYINYFNVDSTGTDSVSSVFADMVGNLFLAGGKDTGVANVAVSGNIVTNIPATTGTGGFSVQYGTSNNFYTYFNAMSAANNTSSPAGMLIDSSNNYILHGYKDANGTQYKNISLNTRTNLVNSNVMPGSAAGSYSGAAFITKMNQFGQVQWNAYTSGSFCHGSGIDTDSNGNFYILTDTGFDSAKYFIDAAGTQTTLFNPGEIPTSIIKVNSNGVFQWAVNFVGPRCYSSGIPPNKFVDSTGASFATGRAGGFGSTSLVIYNKNNTAQVTYTVSLSDNTALLPKWNTDGTVAWVAGTFGGNNNGLGIDIDGSDNVYYCLSRNGNNSTVYNGNQVSSGITLSGNILSLIKYNTSGTVQYYVYTVISGIDLYNSGSIACHSTGWTVMTDTYASGTCSVYNAGGVSAGVTIPVNTNRAMFIVAYSNTGTYNWYAYMTNISLSKRVTIDSGTGYILVTGQTLAGNPSNIYNAGGGLSSFSIPSTTSGAGFVAVFNSTGTCINLKYSSGVTAEVFITALLNNNTIIITGVKGTSYMQIGPVILPASISTPSVFATVLPF